MKTAAILFCTVFGVCSAQTQDLTRPATVREEPARSPSEPLYRVTVVSRTTKAINYGHLTEPTKVGLKGTVLLPDAEGEARVQGKRGTVEIEVKVNHLLAPTRFGPEYLTYVLWAISPEGRPLNLGELVAGPHDKAKIHVSSDLQAFALIVTAEPYFSVVQPSDAVVLENVLQPGTIGKVEEVDAKYELLPRKTFTYNKPVRESEGPMVSMAQYEATVALYQAQNAIQIARAAGADRYAADSLAKAEQLYQEARNFQDKKTQSKQIVMTAREAAQAAEDARAISAKRQQGSADRNATPQPSGADR
ncbi:MAG: OmpA/MotB domain protein [Bryobacterales bacterium]|nr:OmpA/MotB domain protein [Bryobacterales bacterium]